MLVSVHLMFRTQDRFTHNPKSSLFGPAQISNGMCANGMYIGQRITISVQKENEHEGGINQHPELTILSANRPANQLANRPVSQKKLSMYRPANWAVSKKSDSFTWHPTGQWVKQVIYLQACELISQMKKAYESILFVSQMEISLAVMRMLAQVSDVLFC